MRPERLQLRKGDRIRVRVVEVLEGRALIVEHEGRLFRVVNRGSEAFREGQNLSLVVLSADPLRLGLGPGPGFERRA